MLQNSHYATQYAASYYAKLLKTNYFTHFHIAKHTQSAVTSLVWYRVLWPHKTVNMYSCFYFSFHIFK